MNDEPVANKIEDTVHIKDAKLQEPIFYDPESDRMETYTEFHRRTNMCINTKLGKITFRLISVFTLIAFCYLMYKVSNENKYENKINNSTNIIYNNKIYDNYLKFSSDSIRLA